MKFSPMVFSLMSLMSTCDFFRLFSDLEERLDPSFVLIGITDSTLLAKKSSARSLSSNNLTLFAEGRFEDKSCCESESL